MKIAVIALILAQCLSAFAAQSPQAKSYKFTYKLGQQVFELNQAAPTQEIAFKLAAKECFQKLTGGKYPGEERGLDIIDICANPKM